MRQTTPNVEANISKPVAQGRVHPVALPDDRLGGPPPAPHGFEAAVQRLVLTAVLQGLPAYVEDATGAARVAELLRPHLSEEPEPSPNGDKDDGQEPGLEGGTGNGDGPGVE